MLANIDQGNRDAYPRSAQEKHSAKAPHLHENLQRMWRKKCSYSYKMQEM